MIGGSITVMLTASACFSSGKARRVAVIASALWFQARTIRFGRVFSPKPLAGNTKTGAWASNSAASTTASASGPSVEGLHSEALSKLHRGDARSAADAFRQALSIGVPTPGLLYNAAYTGGNGYFSLTTARYCCCVCSSNRWVVTIP